jgi:hypothetical protein
MEHNLTSIGAPIWASTSAGIHTLKNVGIGTTNPRFLLEVGAVGASGTTLFVNGDARITGIVTIGPASITLDGTTNIINVGTGIAINGSTGIISATSIVLGGTTLNWSCCHLNYCRVWNISEINLLEMSRSLLLVVGGLLNGYQLHQEFIHYLMLEWEPQTPLVLLQ